MLTLLKILLHIWSDSFSQAFPVGFFEAFGGGGKRMAGAR
jgi:hypothetical protein